MMEEVIRNPVRRKSVDTIEALFRAEYVPMVRLAYTLVGNNAEAEELVQDSFAMCIVAATRSASQGPI